VILLVEPEGYFSIKQTHILVSVTVFGETLKRNGFRQELRKLKLCDIREDNPTLNFHTHGNVERQFLYMFRIL
jgi:hypothetical protein